jgi:hypothetical protein
VNEKIRIVFFIIHIQYILLTYIFSFARVLSLSIVSVVRMKLFCVL